MHPPKVWPLPGVSSSPEEGVWAFRSRPDLSPPAVEVTTQAHDDTAPGYIFVALKEGAGEHGPMIIDDSGQLVWFGKDRSARDFKMQYYRGRPMLTWWEGKVVQGHGVGEYVIFDGSYRESARVRAGNGFRADLHEFLITAQDTALLTAYDAVRMDLSAVGGPEDGAVWDGIAQEVDIETGEVLFEWHSLEHVGIEESYVEPPDNPEYPYDYFHINSIDVDHNNNLLVCARNTWTVYKVERNSGEVLWRLDGKKSDFEMGPGTRFAFQHDARRHKDGTIAIFDNGAHPKVHDHSRGIVVELDEEKMSATLLREYTSPEKTFATSQGNMQLLPNANVFIGWGSEPFISEFSCDGELLFDARFPPDGESYRAFRFPWSGRPIDGPAVAVEQRPDDKVKLYASWNGATEVDSWEVLAGRRPGQLESLGSVPRDGFETAMLVQTSDAYVAVRAKHHRGEILGTTAPVKL
ncbi:MAG: arylsulfotransferase family protein [Actinomycetota bacterium]|nr:arylsulfotransferase family protein [Actinomycetota bacterium]